MFRRTRQVRSTGRQIVCPPRPPPSCNFPDIRHNPPECICAVRCACPAGSASYVMPEFISALRVDGAHTEPFCATAHATVTVWSILELHCRHRSLGTRSHQHTCTLTRQRPSPSPCFNLPPFPQGLLSCIP